MNKKILASIFVIGILALAMGWGTYSFFSDTEKSTGNVFTAGTIDIAVDNQNPWTATYSAELSDVKPSENRWITFVITNPGKNPVNVWKQIKVIECSGGIKAYPKDVPVASSEPEYEEGWDGSKYVERCWLPPYILYDLWTSVRGDIVTATQQIRVDNINCMWIYLGQIPAEGSMTVSQSYHLSSWKDAAELDVTNWAQGDTMKFDIELYAEQVSGVGPAVGTLRLENKDPTTWEVIADSKYGELNIGAKTFKAYGLTGGDYKLIYYKDPWSTGETGSVLLGKGTASGGSLEITGLGLTGIPASDDKNYPVGGKIWLVPSGRFSGDTVGGTGTLTWAPSEFLFEMHLINVP